MESKSTRMGLARRERCKLIQNKLSNLWSFLVDCLPLANSQGSEFIVSDLWSKLVPRTIQDELIEMSDTQLSLLPCLTLPNKNRFVRCNQATSIGIEKHDKKTECPFPGTATSSSGHVTKEAAHDMYCHQQGQFTSVETFVLNAQEHVLPGSNLLTNLSDILDILNLKKIDQSNMPSKGPLMSQKKNHEVDKMANVCSELGRSFKTSLTVDLGSGKGYLGTQLCYQYQQIVIGIDASQNNTDGANKRTDRLTKEHVMQTRVKKGVPCQEKTSVSKENVQLILKDTQLDSRLSQPSKSASQDISDTFSEMELLSNLSPNTASYLSQKEDKSDSEKGPFRENEKIQVSDKLFDVSFEFPSMDTVNDWKRRFVPLTKYVDCNMSIIDSVGGALNELRLNPEEVNILLTGLHTCGGLGASILKLFVNSPNVAVLCNVACCYNLLQEKKIDTGDSEVYDFPMSSYLQKMNVKLGKAARNIACLSVQRMAEEDKLQGQAFYPRALLQKIVSDMFEDFNWEGHNLRRIDKRSKSLHDYIFKCFIKLGLPTEKVTPELVESYNKRFSHVERQLSAFVQLRAVLAPCIESLILLDRYLYLLQQESVADVFLTQLFDPVISPRCYAIIATKHKSE